MKPKFKKMASISIAGSMFVMCLSPTYYANLDIEKLLTNSKMLKILSTEEIEKINKGISLLEQTVSIYDQDLKELFNIIEGSKLVNFEAENNLLTQNEEKLKKAISIISADRLLSIIPDLNSTQVTESLSEIVLEKGAVTTLPIILAEASTSTYSKEKVLVFVSEITKIKQQLKSPEMTKDTVKSLISEHANELINGAKIYVQSENMVNKTIENGKNTNISDNTKDVITSTFAFSIENISKNNGVSVNINDPKTHSVNDKESKVILVDAPPVSLGGNQIYSGGLINNGSGGSSTSGGSETFNNPSNASQEKKPSIELDKEVFEQAVKIWKKYNPEGVSEGPIFDQAIDQMLLVVSEHLVDAVKEYTIALKKLEEQDLRDQQSLQNESPKEETQVPIETLDTPKEETQVPIETLDTPIEETAFYKEFMAIKSKFNKISQKTPEEKQREEKKQKEKEQEKIDKMTPAERMKFNRDKAVKEGIQTNQVKKVSEPSLLSFFSVKNGIVKYKEKLYTGLRHGLQYKDGKLRSDNNYEEGILYDKHTKTPFSGEMDGLHFKEGKVFNGEDNKGLRYKDGKPFTGVAKDPHIIETRSFERNKIIDIEKTYEDGKRIKNGKTVNGYQDDGKFYKDGLLANGKIGFSQYFYVNGEVVDISNKKVIGIVKIGNDERYYRNGKAYNGFVKDVEDKKDVEVLYEYGKKYNCIKEGIMYENGRPLSSKGDEEYYYEDGKLRYNKNDFTGTHNELVYNNGELINGINQKNGLHYIEGKIADGFVNDVMYDKGNIVNGVHTDGVKYINGKVISNVIKDGILYILGKPANGNYYGVDYINGQPDDGNPPSVPPVIGESGGPILPPSFDKEIFNTTEDKQQDQEKIKYVKNKIKDTFLEALSIAYQTSVKPVIDGSGGPILPPSFDKETSAFNITEDKQQDPEKIKYVKNKIKGIFLESLSIACQTSDNEKILSNIKKIYALNEAHTKDQVLKFLNDARDVHLYNMENYAPYLVASSLAKDISSDKDKKECILAYLYCKYSIYPDFYKDKKNVEYIAETIIRLGKQLYKDKYVKRENIFDSIIYKDTINNTLNEDLIHEILATL